MTIENKDNLLKEIKKIKLNILKKVYDDTNKQYKSDFLKWEYIENNILRNNDNYDNEERLEILTKLSKLLKEIIEKIAKKYSS